MTENNAPVVDIDEHRGTYRMFTRLTLWSTVGLAVILILMAIFLT